MYQQQRFYKYQRADLDIRKYFELIEFGHLHINIQVINRHQICSLIIDI